MATPIVVKGAKKEKFVPHKKVRHIYKTAKNNFRIEHVPYEIMHVFHATLIKHIEQTKHKLDKLSHSIITENNVKYKIQMTNQEQLMTDFLEQMRELETEFINVLEK